MAGQVGRGQRRSGARCPGGGGVSRGRCASRWRAVSGGRRRVQGARRWAPARGVQLAAACPGGGALGSGARCPGVRRAVSGGRIAGVDIYVLRWAQHKRRAGINAPRRGTRLFIRLFEVVACRFHVEHQLRCKLHGQHGRAGIWGALLRVPISARPVAAGKVRALASHGQAGSSGRGGGGARAGRGRGAGAAAAGRGRGAGAFGALVAVVAHYKKCSEWRRTRLHSLALFGMPPLHFL